MVKEASTAPVSATGDDADDDADADDGMGGDGDDDDRDDDGDGDDALVRHEDGRAFAGQTHPPDPGSPG